MRKGAVLILAACAGTLLLAAPSRAAPRAQCGLPDAKPLWIDFADGSVPFWSTVFARPGVVAAAANFLVPPQLRAKGAKTVYFDLDWRKRVGSPSAPAKPETIAPSADRLFDTAAQSSACEQPLIALNELFGASLPVPLSDTAARYRANVLAYVRRLAERGARPFLLVSSRPFTGGEAADWWRQVAQSADIVLEVYFSGRSVWSQGPILGNRRLRTTLRTRVEDLLRIGIPPARLGIMLQLGSTPGAGGRERLQPAQAWLEVVKWEALAARQVARELSLSTIWSWGWGTWSRAADDPDKQRAACVWLWTRDASLCDGPAAAGAGWDASLTEGQAALPRGLVCTLGDARVPATAVAALARVTGDRDAALTALVARAAGAEAAPVGGAEVLAAERSVVATRVGGSRARYLAALGRAKASETVARGVLADELRRAAVSTRLRVAAPTAMAIRTFYATYAGATVRVVESSEPVPWLAGRRRGLALDLLAPPRVFALPDGRSSSVLTPTGPVRVEPLGEPEPLGEVPLPQARDAVAAALRALAREDAYLAWSAGRQRSAQARLACAHDALPQVAAIDLTDYLPFLALPL